MSMVDPLALPPEILWRKAVVCGLHFRMTVTREVYPGTTQDRIVGRSHRSAMGDWPEAEWPTRDAIERDVSEAMRIKRRRKGQDAPYPGVRLVECVEVAGMLEFRFERKERS